MIQETELALFVPAPELLVRLASGDRPLGIRASAPRIRLFRETYFDTPDQALRHRGMTCRLRQKEGRDPLVIVTVGEGPNQEGITSRTRLAAYAVGAGVFETLRGDSEAALRVQAVVDPLKLRPQMTLDIQRLSRIYPRGVLRRPVLYLLFDRVTVQAGFGSAVFHEMRVRRLRRGGPPVQELARELRDRHHLFPDGLTTLQRAYRILALERRAPGPGLSPYALSVALALFREGRVGLLRKGNALCIPTFRGSGEDAARALAADLAGEGETRLLRLGTTEPQEEGGALELWALPETPPRGVEASGKDTLAWVPWHALLERAGGEGLREPNLVAALLLLSQKRLQGQLPWIPPYHPSRPESGGEDAPDPPELRATAALQGLLRRAEDPGEGLEPRLEAASALSRSLSRLFLEEVARAKTLALAGEAPQGEIPPRQLLGVLSIRVRGILDRLYHLFREELIPALELQGVHPRSWEGLMHQDRGALLDDFASRLLPSLGAPVEWGPAFVPEIPSGGCAAGVLARSREGGRLRFFHVVLGEDAPSFLAVPETTTLIPLEEVVREYFVREYPDLEGGESYPFRFTSSDARRAEEGAGAAKCMVVRVVIPRAMPDGIQAQLLHALAEQAVRPSPLIGWADLFPAPGPLDLSGLERFLAPGPPGGQR